MTGLVEHLLSVPTPLAYAVIGFLVFAEAAIFVGFVLPGETAVILGGVLASTGRISLAYLLVLVVAAAVLGDTVGYEVGKHLGGRILGLRLLRRYQSRLDGARAFLRERGGWAVFVGRFTAFLRAVMPGLAGVSRMPYPRFLAFNAAGGLVWGVTFCLVGYFAGSSYARVESIIGRSSAALAAVLALAALGWWLWHRHHERAESAPSDVAASDEARIA